MADQRISIDIPSAPTSLWVGRGAIARLPTIFAAENIPLAERCVLLVSDANVASHAARVRATLLAAGARVSCVELVASESDKSMRAVETVWNALLEAGATRGALLVALGGGLIGDVAGFAAASYLRGIDLVQIPTTLLAMVDASIGGKTGINLTLPRGGLGKNLAGAFWQPRVTVADSDTLTTLGQRELRAGLAECVKHAVIAGGALWTQLEADATSLAHAGVVANEISNGGSTSAEHLAAHFAAHLDALDRLIPASAQVKAHIVARDPHERSERALLNLGHTFGHAIETIPELKLNHGEAVAIGLVAALRTAVELHMLDHHDEARVKALLVACGLPIALREPVSAAEIRRRMGFDKKNDGSTLRLILPRALGRVEIVTDPSSAAVSAGLAGIGAV